MNIFAQWKRDCLPEKRIAAIWKVSVQFHGKECRHLAIGVRVCETALRRLQIDALDRDRLVCVSESDGCAVDAIQAGLGCSIGKKHLLFFNTGRLIFSVYDLKSDHAVRICVKPEVAESDISIGEILTMPEEALFYFEQARPMTEKVRRKVNRGCEYRGEESHKPLGSIHDSSEPFREFDESKF